MTTTVADFLVRRLREWHVDHVFGYPGDGINGIIGAFGRAQRGAADGDLGAPRFVQARHEEMSAFQAVGYAKVSGRVGVCLATSGPGAIHLLTGLYDAKLDHVPVVAIVGQTERAAMGGSYQQEVDLHTLFKDVCAEHVVDVTVPEQLPNALDRAMRIALAKRVPTALIVHADVQELDYEPPRHEFRQVPSSPPSLAGPPSVVPPETELRRAAEVIEAGERVAILVGQGAREAAPQVVELADLTGAGVAKALLGKDVLSDELPFVTGAIGLLGTRASYELMRDCDTLIMIGSNFPYSQFLPEYGKARAVQIDVDAANIGLRYPVEVTLVGDAATTLDALLPLLTAKSRGWRDAVESSVRDWRESIRKQAMVDAEPVNPMRIVAELSDRVPDDAIVTADSGSVANWYARLLDMRGTMRGTLSGTLASMGAAVPYAIGAKFAHPGRPVIALVGDGAMQMNNLAELITIARHRHEWPDQRLVVCVLHNQDLNQVTWELRAMGGEPTYPDSQELPDVDHAGFARSIGLGGINVDHPDALGPAWDRALAADVPTVLDVRCDPEVPPIPPHVTVEQIRDLTAAVLKGDPGAWRFVKQGVKALISS